MESLLGYTIEQINLFARLAERRRRYDMMAQAQVSAIGTNAGFSGKDEPLKALARSLDLTNSSSPGASLPGQVRDAIQGLIEAKRRESNGN